MVFSSVLVAYIMRYLCMAYTIKLLLAIAEYISGPSFVYMYVQ